MLNMDKLQFWFSPSIMPNMTNVASASTRAGLKLRMLAGVASWRAVSMLKPSLGDITKFRNKGF